MDGTDGTDGTDGSVDAAGNGESLARICRVLTTARSIDLKASTRGAANEDNDATLVRVAAGDGVNPSSLAALLRSACRSRRWPSWRTTLRAARGPGPRATKAEQRKRAIAASERPGSARWAR